MLIPTALQQLDERFSYWVYAHATPMVDAWMLGITRAGNVTVIWTVLVLAAIFLLLQRRKREAFLLIMGMALSSTVDGWLKAFFARPRPQLLAASQRLIALPGSYSLPSGHALLNATLYGLLAFFLGQMYPRFRGLIYALSALWIGLIGFSRVYLGVHWLSDIVAGWLVASLIVLGAAQWQRILMRRNF